MLHKGYRDGGCVGASRQMKMHHCPYNVCMAQQLSLPNGQRGGERRLHSSKCANLIELFQVSTSDENPKFSGLLLFPGQVQERTPFAFTVLAAVLPGDEVFT